jgi:hypothetical protein
MAVPSELPSFFDPEDICERTSANIESQVPNVDVLDEWNPRRFVLPGADVNIWTRIFSNDVGDAGMRIDRHKASFLNCQRSFAVSRRRMLAQKKTENAIAPPFC